MPFAKNSNVSLSGVFLGSRLFEPTSPPLTCSYRTGVEGNSMSLTPPPKCQKTTIFRHDKEGSLLLPGER